MTVKVALLNEEQTLTNKTLTEPVLTSPVINGGFSGSAFLDEDTLASDSATKLASQQSIKAYVDSGEVTMSNKTFTSPVFSTLASGTAFLDEDAMGSDSATKAASQQSIKAYTDAEIVTAVAAIILNWGRAQFTWNGGATAYTIKVGPAGYMCKDKVCTWTSELTTSAIGTPSDSTWYYLYLDYSAITSGTAITNSELIWSDTAPSYNGTYRAWMNGDDRAIFMVKTSDVTDFPIASNINEFFHHTNLVMLSSPWPVDAAHSDTPTAQTIACPSICTRAIVTTFFTSATSDADLHWYTTGASQASGHLMATVDQSEEYDQVWTGPVIGDTTNHQITLVISGDGAGTAVYDIYTNGWFLPTGM